MYHRREIEESVSNISQLLDGVKAMQILAIMVVMNMLLWWSKGRIWCHTLT
jgi:hypothetical protein